MYLERCAVFEAAKVDAIAKALLHRDWQLTAAANLYEYAKYASEAVCEVRAVPLTLPLQPRGAPPARCPASPRPEPPRRVTHPRRLRRNPQNQKRELLERMQDEAAERARTLAARMPGAAEAKGACRRRRRSRRPS